MKLAGYKKAYEDLSGTASGVNRQLAFAGIAVIWVFRHGEGAGCSIPDDLVAPLLCFTLALAFDLGQYVCGALLWHWFYRCHERNGVKQDGDIVAPTWKNRATWWLFSMKNGIKQDGDIVAPTWMNWATWWLFGMKIGAVVSGYRLLIGFLWYMWLRP